MDPSAIPLTFTKRGEITKSGVVNVFSAKVAGLILIPKTFIEKWFELHCWSREKTQTMFQLNMIW